MVWKDYPNTPFIRLTSSAFFGTVANICGNIIMLSKDHRRSEHKERLKVLNNKLLTETKEIKSRIFATVPFYAYLCPRVRYSLFEF